jgi:ABC-type transporter Mla subunit MlaD
VNEEDANTAGTPRWVKVFGIVVLVLVLLVVVMLVIGGGHGPGRHTAAIDADGYGSPNSTLTRR